MRNYILAGAFVFALAGAAAATVLKLELPAGYDAGMVLDPAPGDDDKLREFSCAELAKMNEPDGIYVVVFTKNGEGLYRNSPQYLPEDGNPPFFGDIELARSPYGYPGWTDRKWADVIWHLHEVYDGSSGVYELARDAFFGPPFTYSPGGVRTVEVELDEHYPENGIYYPSIGKIGLKWWRASEPAVDPIDVDTDRGYLTRCMLHAFRHEWDAPWDHFDCGTIHAAWIAIQNAICGPTEEPYFNDLWHDEKKYERPPYMHLMAYNVPEMATRLPGFFSPECGLDNSIMWARYLACGYLWWKVFREDNDFFKEFNGELAKLWKECAPDFRALYLAAERVYNGGPIEGYTIFGDWFSRQPMLNDEPWCGEICAQVTYRNESRVYAYYRGSYVEVPYANKEVHWNVYDWDGTPRYTKDVYTNEYGYAKFVMPYFPYNGEDQRIKVTARVNMGYQWTDVATAYTASLDGTHDEYELFGVTHDADEGTIRIEYPPGIYNQPLVNGLFKLSNFDGDPGAGDYSITYISSKGGAKEESLTHLIKKDGGNFFFTGNVISDATPSDFDDNGIPDYIEPLLAEKFKPYVHMHLCNPLHPCTVEVTLGTGALVDTEEYPDIWYMPPQPYPEHLDEMKKLFEGHAHEWTDDWCVTFGPAIRGVDVPEYWFDWWDIYQSYGWFTEPFTYFNIFPLHGKPVIQYWFFYPFNDWGNDHEGDWEHINVRISGPSPNTSELDEVVYYFHKHRKTLPEGDPRLQVNGGTHPYVYVGGRYLHDGDADGYSGDCSGGSYWRSGYFENVGEFYTDESVMEPVTEIPLANLNVEWIGRTAFNPHFWWGRFPGRWGRPKHHLNNPTGYTMDGPPGPWNHECWWAYQHPGYPEYEYDQGLASTAPPFAGPEPLPSSEAAAFESPVASSASPPNVGEYQSPSAGEYLSPVASSGGGADTPGDDSAPPLAATPPAFGGDSLSGRAAAARFGRGGPLAAASAEPLSCRPNPVSCAATITFKVEAPCRVNLAIFDISGRRVAALADGPYAAGEHSASWQADVPPGVYIYRLRAGDDVAVKKLVVAR